MRYLFSLALCAGCFATSIGSRYYLTETPRTVRAPHADSVIVHLDEKTVVELNARFFLGRKEQLEQAACLRVERIERGEIWVDSVLSASIVTDRTTIVQIVYSCDVKAVPWHAHVVLQQDGWDQCVPSAIDMNPGWAKYPAEILSCGFGVDSMVAWRARR